MPCLSAACAFCPPPLKGLGWGRKRGGDPSSIVPQSGPREGIGKEGEGLLSPFILPRWGLRNENCPQPGQSEGMKGGPKTSSRASSRPDFGNRPSRGGVRPCGRPNAGGRGQRRPLRCCSRRMHTRAGTVPSQRDAPPRLLDQNLKSLLASSPLSAGPLVCPRGQMSWDL